MKLERLEYRTSSWDPALRAYVAALGAKKPVVLIGDLNGEGACAAAWWDRVISVVAIDWGVLMPYRPPQTLLTARRCINGLLGITLCVPCLRAAVAYLDMDVHDPVTSRNKTPGFCDGERDGFAALLSSSGAGLVDVWRAAHPKLRQFTYWSARFNCRGNNKGWRLDYALVSPSLTPCVVSDAATGLSRPGAVGRCT
jgi:subtilisin family serine protease